ncbi:hypothetical protein [Vibrio sp. Hep-1b-8]|uniref:hypothetical protein n=1 Tax=Vibrio sp. Hep-1b-8 TaxID=2144187 RepID=UPI00111023F9|nr:hypothetical protein [Vibrio sp. Hep-1b-8]TMX34089.1 hypothetical protein DA100_16300 [Vibrio sp. Hep-1b-8]
MNKKINSLLFVTLLSASHLTYANQGQITLMGSVTTQTCELFVAGADASGNVVELGVVPVNGVGSEVSFELKPDPTSPCASLTGANMLGADVTWGGSALSGEGIRNENGSAVGSVVELTAKPAAGSTVINSLNPTVAFAASEATGAAASMAFSAKLKAGATAGTYASTISYTVAYK